MAHPTLSTRMTNTIVLSCIMSLMLISSMLISCSRFSTECPKTGNGQSSKSEDNDGFKDIHDMSSLITICLVPLDNISKSQMEELKENLKTNFTDSVWNAYDFAILDRMPSPDSCKNDLKTRLSAKKMVSFLENNYGKIAEMKSKKGGIDLPDYYIIGVTNRDIAKNVHGKDDYGILGLSYTRYHKASIVSTYRLRNKKDLWKLALHEFGHGYFGAPHCPNDDPHCILQDAKGGNPHFEKKSSLCRDCTLACDPDV